MGRCMERAEALRLRVRHHARAGLQHRHPAADGLRLPARGSRVRLLPGRHDRPLPAHAREERLLPAGLGRQWPAHRAPGAELLRGALRSLAPLRRRLHAPAGGRRQQVLEGREPAAGLTTQLHRALLRATHRDRREVLRGRLPHARAVRRLESQLSDYQRSLPGHQPAPPSSRTSRPARRTRPRPPPCGTSPTALRWPRPSRRTANREGAYHASASPAPTGLARRSSSPPPVPSCCRRASRSSPTRTTSGTRPCSEPPSPRRCSTSRCPVLAHPSPSPTRARASP